MQTRDVVIVSACRTAIGKFQGMFKDVSARELAITAGKEESAPQAAVHAEPAASVHRNRYSREKQKGEYLTN